MSSPAKDARLAAIAKGFTEIVKRGNNHIIMRNPTTKRCLLTAQIGNGWHYGENQETDTAWEPGTSPWQWKMTRANYNLFALSNFKAGQILKWVDPLTGESVTFQPQSLKWTNSINQIQQISFAQNVQAIVEDDKITWPGAYGEGRDFTYVAGPVRMQKVLKISNPLPTTSYNILELEFIMAPSNGVEIIINGEVWDKKTRYDTANEVYFRAPRGAVLWTFSVPTIFDSAGNEATGTLRLRKSGNSLYCAIRFDKSWIDNAVYPIYMDPTVDCQIGASGDDANWAVGTAYFNKTNTTNFYGASAGYCFGTRFPNVEIPDGAEITESYLSFYGAAKNGAITGYIYADKAANPSQIASYSDGDGRTKTNARIAFTDSEFAVGWYNTGDISSIIEELLTSYSYKDGSAMQFLAISVAGSYYLSNRSYDYSGNTYGAKLHIEYTEGSASSWAGTWGG